MKKVKYKYVHDGNLWEWWPIGGKKGIYYHTDENGEGVFRIDQNCNDFKQLTGTMQFSVHGLSEKYAKHKIMEFMKNNLLVPVYEEPMTAEEYANIPNPFEDEMEEDN